VIKFPRIWLVVTLVSVAELLLLGGQWYAKHHHYRPDPGHLVDQAAVDRYLGSQATGAANGVDVVPTGVFIQSLRFENSSEVNVTGYVWQRHRPDRPRETRGFVLPQAVQSGTNVAPEVAYERKDGDLEVTGWYFEASLRQRFNYHDYPLDHKTVRIRLWAKELADGDLLVPSLADYASTADDVVFGIDSSIVLEGWDIEETFFDFKRPEYDTTFGVAKEPTRRGRPELYFNVVIKRRFLNAFITNLIPLLAVAVLLFAVMLTVTGDKDHASKLGFSTSGILASTSALFFVVMLAHIQLRQEIIGDVIVYLETFYFLMYVAILGVAINTLLFTSRSDRRPRWLVWRDNVLSKALFWPVLLTIANVTTWFML